jgi:endonuclease III
MSIPVYSQPSLKLGEAIELLRKTDDPDAVMTESMNSVAAQAFEQHDAVHVIFGLDICAGRNSSSRLDGLGYHCQNLRNAQSRC